MPSEVHFSHLKISNINILDAKTLLIDFYKNRYKLKIMARSCVTSNNFTWFDIHKNVLNKFIDRSIKNISTSDIIDDKIYHINNGLNLFNNSFICKIILDGGDEISLLVKSYSSINISGWIDYKFVI